MSEDWYDRRNELECDQVFRTHAGNVVKLDHRLPGDGTDWVVQDWFNGWACYESRLHPGDLAKRLPDNFAG